MRRLGSWLLIGLVTIAFGPPLLTRIFGWGPDPHRLPPKGKAVAIGDGLELNVVDVGSGADRCRDRLLPQRVFEWVLSRVLPLG